MFMSVFSRIYLVALSGLVFLGSSFAAGPEPVLDLRATKNGDFKNFSGKKVNIDVDAGKVEAQEDGLLILGGRAATILFDAKSPIFGKGSFTWILKCKFKDPLAPSDSPILFGRWEVGKWNDPQNLRVAAIGLVPEKGTLNFMLSPDGTAEACVGGQSTPIPAESWIQIALRVEMGQYMGFSVFDAKGDLIFEEKIKEIDFEHLFDASSDLIINAGPDVGVTFARARVWDKALSFDQVEKAVSERE